MKWKGRKAEEIASRSTWAVLIFLSSFAGSGRGVLLRPVAGASFGGVLCVEFGLQQATRPNTFAQTPPLSKRACTPSFLTDLLPGDGVWQIHSRMRFIRLWSVASVCDRSIEWGRGWRRGAGKSRGGPPTGRRRRVNRPAHDTPPAFSSRSLRGCVRMYAGLGGCLPAAARPCLQGGLWVPYRPRQAVERFGGRRHAMGALDHGTED